MIDKENTSLAGNQANEPLYTIEPARPEETKKAEKRIREYHKDPSSFVPFKKELQGNSILRSVIV